MATLHYISDLLWRTNEALQSWGLPLSLALSCVISLNESLFGITATANIAPLKWREACKVLRGSDLTTSYHGGMWVQPAGSYMDCIPQSH